MKDLNEVTTTIEASGNNMKSHRTYDTFMEISGTPETPGMGGNKFDDEVHVLMRSNDGEFSQGWFRVSDIKRAIELAGFYA